MPAHRALGIPEMVALIINELNPGTVTHGLAPTRHMQDTLTMALTCKVFCGPALDALWQILQSLDPVMKILGAVIINGKYVCLPHFIIRPLLRNFDQVLLSPISLEAWSKVEEYTSRTRILQIGSEALDRIHPSAFTHLARISTPMFPKLSQIYLESSLINSPATTMFLTPSLSSFSAEEWFSSHIIDPQNAASLLFTLAWKTPSLQRLTISHIPHNAFESFKTLQKLRVLEISECLDVNYALIRELAMLPDLVELDIGFPSNSAQLAMPQTILPGFRCLRQLLVTGGPIPLSQLFRMISGEDGALRNVMIDYHPTLQVTNITQVAPYFLDLHKQISQFKSIKVLRINIPKLDDVLPESLWAVATSMAMPLFESNDMLEVLAYRGPLSLSDDAIAKIAASLPRLETFLVEGCIGPYLTPLALSSFAQHCPDLKSLHLPIDFDHGNLNAIQVEKHGLSTFVFGAPFQNANRVARVLDRLFPTIQMVWSVVDEQFHEAHVVESIIKDICQPVRDDQRVRDLHA